MDLLTPLRLTAQVAIGALEVTQWVAGALEHQLRYALGDEPAVPAPDQAAPPRAAPPRTPTVSPDVTPAGRVARPPAERIERMPAAPPTNAKVIDDTPELVESDGSASPGAEVHVDEPWRGYAQMTAADIVDRLIVADPAAKAVVRLYEQRHKGRKSVLAATAA